jgi:cytoskeletal protein RodZ
MQRAPGPSTTPEQPEANQDRQAALQRLGATLRDARERQGLSLSALAVQLHMGEEQLQALEGADAAHLPEAVFVIAQSRRVAAALGIDVGPLLTPLKPGTSLAPHPAAGSQAVPWRLPLLGLGAGLLLAALVGAGLWGWQQRRHPAGTRTTTAPGPRRMPVHAGSSSSTLRLSSREPSWLEVQNASGQVLFQGLLQGERRFAVNGGLRVKAGRPDLVQVSLGSQPARALGPIEQIRWVSVPAASATAP